MIKDSALIALILIAVVMSGLMARSRNTIIGLEQIIVNLDAQRAQEQFQRLAVERRFDDCQRQWTGFAEFVQKEGQVAARYVPPLPPGIEPPAANPPLPPYIAVNGDIRFPMTCGQ